MSTVSEVITARHGNMRVLALSLITNIAVIEKTPSATTTLTTSLAEGKATHAEVVEAGAEAASDIQKIVAHLVGKLTTQ
jgi:purine-nucleoside phosphorylase